MAYFHLYKCLQCLTEFKHWTAGRSEPELPVRTLHSEVGEIDRLALVDEKKDYAKWRGIQCFGVLQFISTHFQNPPAPEQKPLSELAEIYWGSLKEKPGMVCAARLRKSPYTVRYGKSAHGILRGELAGHLGEFVPDPGAAVCEWSATNCAEVEAAHKMLETLGVAFGETGGVDFYCIDSQGNHRPPCVNCGKWVGRV